MTTPSGLVTPHFSWREMGDREGNDMPRAMVRQVDWLCKEKLEPMREAYGGPLLITSGYRSPFHSAEEGKKRGPGAHTHGLAVDVHCLGLGAKKLLAIAEELGVLGIGVKQHGDHPDRFLHFDWWQGDDKHPRPWVWSYK